MTNKSVKKVYLVCKRSVYQKYVLDEKDPHVKQFLRGKNRSIRPMKKIHKAHYESIREIEEFLRQKDIAYGKGFRHNINDLKGYDLIITIGGDGTFLRTANRLKQGQMIMGINSLTRVSVGALCSATHKNFRRKLSSILKGDYVTRELPLMKIRINGKALPVESVNDVLFANTSPGGTSRYLVQFRGIREEHKSSGVWVATATGSTAAINAAGGLRMPRDDKRLQFLVREPYQGIYNPYRLTRGFIPKGKSFKIINKMFEARLFIDGPTTCYRLQVGDEIECALSGKTLKVIT